MIGGMFLAFDDTNSRSVTQYAFSGSASKGLDFDDQETGAAFPK
jgi:hypothetical protein